MKVFFEVVLNPQTFSSSELTTFKQLVVIVWDAYASKWPDFVESFSNANEMKIVAKVANGI